MKFFWLFCALVASVPAVTLIPANSVNINYYGRFDVTTPTQPRFNWSGTIIEAAFDGPTIGFDLQDGYADYDIEIDGRQDSTLVTMPSQTRYIIAQNLADRSHTIRIVRRSEHHWNAAVFGGFVLADGKNLLIAPVKTKRTIEFIGDSYTVGYGNESPAKVCTANQLRSFTNTNQAFGPIITRVFGAQSVVLGWSGKGLVRNYGDDTKRSAEPYPLIYDKTLGALPGVWDFNRWKPDLVVICLGTNDFSTLPHPDDTMFIADYHRFIDRICSNYPPAKILCVSPGSGPYALIQQVVAAQTTTRGRAGRVFFGELPQTMEYSGCASHPSVNDDRAIAAALIPKIQQITGWDTATAAVRQRLPLRQTENLTIIRCLVAGKNLVKITLAATVPTTAADIFDLHGRHVCRLSFDDRSERVWNSAGEPRGIYFVKASGSDRVVARE
jgi:lysophospholipase L1-like esterase